ncbi:MAG: bifunctional metallophosphatase/5'-nucleotidase [Gammaproteobacteria bacterium]|nr:bifunctional metallophosphatase/5'-nucleotidase [Gammaproteobacteria bacterium]
MLRIRRPCLLVVATSFLVACQPGENGTKEAIPAPAAGDVVTILFTNDVESAYDPIPAYWLDDLATIGGIAHMTTLIDEIRSTEPNVLLFDSGDIFTGSLAKLTDGELAFELMITMGYDAMAIGNHEFEYGHDILEWQKHRASFPVLGANLFYKGTQHPFAQAHTVIEQEGVRIGVIGIMGQDAATAIIPSYIEPIDVIDPAIAVRKSVDELRDDVDLIVLLTHQGKTAPMQTDAESDPRLQRDIDADIALAGAVPGIDVLLAGHADAGTPVPVINEKSGTIIMQTYGQATHLGYLQITLDPESRGIVDYDGKLIPVDADRWKADSRIDAKLAQYRAAHPELLRIIGRTAGRMNRRYIEESDLGNLFTDAFVAASGADIGLLHNGSLRKDLPGGEIQLVDLLDTYPFVDDVNVKSFNGEQLRQIFEQSLTLERGMLQVAGIEVTYDLSKPEYQRLVSLQRNGAEIADDEELTIAAPGFLTEGGDLYETFRESPVMRSVGKVPDVMIDYFAGHDVVPVPPRGRQTDVSR